MMRARENCSDRIEFNDCHASAREMKDLRAHVLVSLEGLTIRWNWTHEICECTCIDLAEVFMIFLDKSDFAATTDCDLTIFPVITHESEHDVSVGNLIISFSRADGRTSNVPDKHLNTLYAPREMKNNAYTDIT